MDMPPLPPPPGPLAIERSRLERSLSLTATPAGRGRYRVSGGAEEHWVALRESDLPLCDCGDLTWRQALCKHVLAALAAAGDVRVLLATAELATQMRRELDQMRRVLAQGRPRIVRSVRRALEEMRPGLGASAAFRYDPLEDPLAVDVIDPDTGTIVGQVVREPAAARFRPAA